jgi:hypothetical protein
MAVVVALIFGWKFLYSKEEEELNDWDIEGLNWNIDGLINLIDSEINCKT